MKLNKKQAQFLERVIAKWEIEKVLTKEEAGRLKNSFTTQAFNWKILAKYSFWIAIVCAVIGFSAAVADKNLIEFIEQIFSSSDIALCSAFAILAAIAYFTGLRRQKSHPEKKFSNEAILFAAVLLTAASVIYLGRALDNGSKHFSILFLLAAIIYGVVGLAFPSRLVWVFSLLSLGSWFGTETGYESGWGDYYLGMNYPMRFVAFGLALVAFSFCFRLLRHRSEFFKPTFTMGLLYLFIALWILSIFGNYGDIDSWERVRQGELFGWSLIFAAIAIVAIAYGLYSGDATSRGFGITFLFINLYTRYFEYFWNVMHKAVFFFIMAISFWVIGQWAEKIWTLKFLQKGGKNTSDSDLTVDTDLGDD